jgi:Flp pilus assembly protein TadG
MNKLRSDSGSVLVFITLMVVILMVVVGMGLDTGYLTFSRSMGQRAVDMAALAGAAGLAKGNVASIEINIEQLNATNDYVKSTGNQIDGAVDPGTGVGTNVTLVQYDTATSKVKAAPVPLTKANAVRVALETTNPYSGTSSSSAINTPAFLTPLMRLFGGGASAASANNVNVSAISTMEALPGLPIALTGCTLSGDTAIPWNQTPSGGAQPNNSGWTTYLDGSVSTPDVKALIHKVAACMGTGGVSVGSNICLNNGALTPDLREMEILIGTNDDGVTPKCYLAPVVPATKTFNGCDNPIVSYAQICPMAVCGPGVNGTINQSLCTKPNSFGKYLFATVKSCDVGDLTAAGLGACYSLKLVRETQAGM